MVRLTFTLALAVAAPAAAQESLNRLAAQQNELWAQQQAAEQEAIARRNERQAQDAQAQTEAHLRELQVLGPAMRPPGTVYAPRPRPGSAPLAQLSPDFPSIPDRDLAASRVRVLAAAANRR